MSLSQLFTAFGSHTYWFLPDISSPPHSIAFANFIDLKKSSSAFSLPLREAGELMYFLHIRSQQLMTFSIKNLSPFGCSCFALHMCLWNTLAQTLHNAHSIICVSRDTQDTQRHFHTDAQAAQTQCLKKMQGVNTQLSIFIPIMKTLGDSCMCEYLQ